MATSPLSQVLQQFRRVAVLRDGEGMSDGQLLESFLARRDTAALDTLVRRHSAMAWGVCRRILHNHHDAEDAFQATFLVLVRRGESIVPREMVASWLYGVAHRIALKARAISARRRCRERPVIDMPAPEIAPDTWADLQPLLDVELARLPDKYRGPVVLCDLEGRTRKQAARQLGWPEGTVAGRLARARKLLAAALARRGVRLSCAALAAEMALHAASTAAPATLVESTVRVATLLTTGAATAGAISSHALALSEGMIRTMMLSKSKTVVTALLIAFLTLGGAAVGWPDDAKDSAVQAQSPAGAPARKAGDDNLRNTLLALDKHVREAAGKGEWQEIQKFYAPEYLGVGTVGKSNYAANVEAVKTHRPTDWKIRDIDVVRVSPDAAVLTYIYDCKVLSPDGRLLQTRQNHRTTLVWGQRSGGWVLVYAHDEHGNRQQRTVVPTRLQYMLIKPELETKE
jgi:RNA polymerase sigma factor (sigma-70 family)